MCKPMRIWHQAIHSWYIDIPLSMQGYPLSGSRVFLPRFLRLKVICCSRQVSQGSWWRETCGMLRVGYGRVLCWGICLGVAKFVALSQESRDQFELFVDRDECMRIQRRVWQGIRSSSVSALILGNGVCEYRETRWFAYNLFTKDTRLSVGIQCIRKNLHQSIISCWYTGACSTQTTPTGDDTNCPEQHATDIRNGISLQEKGYVRGFLKGRS